MAPEEEGVHFVGQPDFSRDCATGRLSAALSLAHLCGDFVHAPWSARPISPNPNPNYVYAFVGPVPFAWGGGPPAAGALIGDATRSTLVNLAASPIVWTCLSEGPVVQGQLSNVATYCACADPTMPPGPDLRTQQTLTLTYIPCPAVAPFTFGLAPFPPIAPTGLSALPLGTWVLPPTTFPGTRRLHHYFGLALAPDPCVTGSLPFHIVNGVMTSGPTGSVIPPPPLAPFLSTVFLDLQNTMVLISGPPFIVISYGGLFLSTRIWSLNLP